jgi:gluconokinase
VAVVVVMGVAGSGKSTVGALLAARLHVAFIEGDDFHDPESIAKMAAGQPLVDAEREPWLRRLHAELVRHQDAGAVLACSALTIDARRLLLGDLPSARLVWLHGDAQLIASRLMRRVGHPVGVALLASQLATLEPPSDAITVDVARDPAELVDQIIAKLALTRLGDLGRS